MTYDQINVDQERVAIFLGDYLFRNSFILDGLEDECCEKGETQGIA